MSTSKVSINNVSIADITDATASAVDIQSGYTAYGSDGRKLRGLIGADNLIFIDYDGTVIDNYNTTDALALESLPANPSHTGLIAEGWNWTLQEIKDYLTELPEATVVVGQLYNTVSGATEFDVLVDEYTMHPYLRLFKFSQTSGWSVTVDWGDGTAAETKTSGDLYFNHDYASTGEYTVKIYCDKAVLYFRSVNKVSSIFSLQTQSAPNFIQHMRLSSFVVPVNYQSFFMQCSVKTITMSAQSTYSPSGAVTDCFFNCPQLKALVLPRVSLSAAQQGFFVNCASLEFVSVPPTLQYDLPFSSASRLAYYTFIQTSGSQPTISKCSSLLKIILREGITATTSMFAYEDVSVETLKLPSTLQTINSQSFSSIKISSITIPSNATIKGSNVFSQCKQLTSINIPNSATISSSASAVFSGDEKLESIVLPQTLTTIHQSMFSGCKNLRQIELPSSVTFIGNSAFYQCYSLEEITIPASVTTLGNQAFTYCQSLRSILIQSNQITSIPQNFLVSCYLLQSIIIPSSVTSIGKYAFQNCTSLTSITIPSNVTSIESGAFMACTALREIHFQPTTPPTLANANAFNSLSANCIIYVPTGTLSDYTSATNYPSSSTYTYAEE